MGYYYKSDYIYHHGVLGQKWGKRNGPPYPLGASDHSASEKKAGWRKSLEKGNDERTNIAKAQRKIHESTIQNYESGLPIEKTQSHRLSDEQKRRIRNVAIGAAAVIGIGAGVYFAYKHHSIDCLAADIVAGASTTKMKETMLQSLNDTTMIFEKGSTFHRMSAVGNIDYSQATKPMYLSWKKEDVATYMTLLKDWSGTGKRYDVVFEAMEDLKVPTKAKAKEVFEQLWNENQVYRDMLSNTLVETYTSKLGLSKDYAERVVSYELASDPFGKAIYSIVAQKEDSKMLIDKFKELGYNAIEDYFDKGSMSDSPLIVFDPSKSLQKKGERFVTKKIKEETLRNLLKSGITKMAAGKYNVRDVLNMVQYGQL